MNAIEKDKVRQEINRLLKEQLEKKYRKPNGYVETNYGYDGDSIPDEVREAMIAQLRAVLMVAKLEKKS